MAAEAAAARAAQLGPHSRSIRHTQAEIARRQALETNDPLLKQSYRRFARVRLGRGTESLSEYDLHTRAKVAIDELREAIEKLGNTPEPAMSTLVVDLTKDAEAAIQTGRSEFPDSAEILAAEADFLDLLNQAPQALGALERAFQLNPRQDWLATRLAKRYVLTGECSRAIDVIQRCLGQNPDSKIAHLQMAHLLRQTIAPRTRVIDHFRRSFTPGDNNFEAQFWYARELFLSNRVRESESVFERLNETAPGRFRTDPSAEVAGLDGGGCISFDGSVTRKEEGYAFIRLIHFDVNVFASRAESVQSIWDHLRTGSQVSCYLRFNRRGSSAVQLTQRRT